MFKRIHKEVNDCFDVIGTNVSAFEEARNHLAQGVFMADKTLCERSETAADILTVLGRIPSYSEKRQSYQDVTIDDIRAITANLTPEMRWTLFSPS